MFGLAALGEIDAQCSEAESSEEENDSDGLSQVQHSKVGYPPPASNPPDSPGAVDLLVTNPLAVVLLRINLGSKSSRKRCATTLWSLRAYCDCVRLR